MNEPSFASLSPTLLARKGGAKPAMRPQHGPIPTAANAAHSLEDLGWNDMGEDAESPREAEVVHLTPAPANAETAAEAEAHDRAADAQLHRGAGAQPAILRQREILAETVASAPKAPVRAHAQPRRQAQPRGSAADASRRAAFTLRLDGERHLKLRLASTLRNCSAQQLVTEALDQLLGAMPDVDLLAAQVRSEP